MNNSTVATLADFIINGSYGDIYINDGYAVITADSALLHLATFYNDGDMITWNVDDDGDLLFGVADLNS